MNTNGNFIGYFAANTAEMSLRMVLQRTFLTEEQLAQFIRNEAASPSNLAIDNQGMLYTVTAGTLPQKAFANLTSLASIYSLRLSVPIILEILMSVIMD